MTVYAFLRFILGKTLTVYLARSQHSTMTQAKRFLETTAIFQRCHQCQEVIVHAYDRLHENCHGKRPLVDELLESGNFDPRFADAQA